MRAQVRGHGPGRVDSVHYGGHVCSEHSKFQRWPVNNHRSRRDIMNTVLLQDDPPRVRRRADCYFNMLDASWPPQRHSIERPTYCGHAGGRNTSRNSQTLGACEELQRTRTNVRGDLVDEKVGVQVSTFQARVNVPMQHHDSTFICLYVEIQSPIILADHISDRFTY